MVRNEINLNWLLIKPSFKTWGISKSAAANSNLKSFDYSLKKVEKVSWQYYEKWKDWTTYSFGDFSFKFLSYK